MQLVLSHNAVKVRDLQGMVAFYRDILGFHVTDQGELSRPGAPGIAFLSQVSSDHHQLAFIEAGAGNGSTGVLEHMAFRVGALDDVRELIERLDCDERATQLETVTHGNAWSVYFRDPEGNRIEVFCDTPWFVPQPAIEPWDRRMDDRALREHTKELFSGSPRFGPIEAWASAFEKQLREDH